MKRVLLVEDNDANRRLIGDHLRRVGFDVTEANLADEGVELAQALEFSLIIMDIQLPGIDGVTATRMLRQHPKTREVPILAVTALAMQKDKERILAAGCSGYIVKPIAYKDFLERVFELTGRLNDLGVGP